METPTTTVHSDDYNIGDSVVALTQPTTEGLIVDRRLREDGKVELTLLVAPFHKKGSPWTKAHICLKEASKLSKRPANTCMFSIPNVHKWRDEAKQAHACPVWMLAAIDEINHKIPPAAQGEFEENDGQFIANSSASRRNSTSSSSSTSLGNKETTTPTNELEQRLEDVLRLSNAKPKKSKKSSHHRRHKTDSTSSSENDRVLKTSKRKHRKSKRHSSSSSSSSEETSSSSSSDESSVHGEVREKSKSGIFSCPFADTDSRGFKDVKVLIKGQATSRKHLRTALHNLYAEHYSMATYTNIIISAANAAVLKPFPSDVAWLQLHAKYLDGILLNAMAGPWTLWNESWLDDITQAFLELLVRVSSTKEYPHCLDDKVRKWMKKRRVGVNPRYGPVTSMMHQAKITENGLQFFQARNTGKDIARWTKKPLPSPNDGESKSK